MQISALHWNQDEDYGGFGGPHCVLPGGYGSITDALAALLPGLLLSTPVAKVEDTAEGVRVTTVSGAAFCCCFLCVWFLASSRGGNPL